MIIKKFTGVVITILCGVAAFLIGSHVVHSVDMIPVKPKGNNTKEQANYQKLKQEVRDFLDENEFDYLFRSEWRLRLLNVLFPSLSKSLAQLLYGMHSLRKLINKP